VVAAPQRWYETGTIVRDHRGPFFVVELDVDGREILCTANKLNRPGRLIRLAVGDKVRCELSPYDPTRGRITWRL